MPQSLMALVSMILEGPNIKEQRCKRHYQCKSSCDYCSVVFMFNSEKVKVSRAWKLTSYPIYLQHEATCTHKKGLIKSIPQLGLA